ncbi:MAG: major facilitator superfamily 1 [Firmicutes bacterium]|nr:major facilitator superfamily 1 [Bacillota bacterium]
MSTTNLQVETTTANSYRWVILALATLSFLFTFMSRFSWPPLIPVVGPVFHMTAAEAGSFMTAFYFGYVITQIPAGILADRLGSRFILAGSLIIPGIMLIAMGHMVTYSQGFWFRFVMGLGAGADMAAASRALTEWFSTRERVVAWGILMASPTAGLMLPNWVVPALTKGFGWQGVFEIFGVTAIVIGILVALFVRVSATSVVSGGNPFGGLKVVFTSKNLILLALAGFCLMWAQIGLATWANAYFHRIGFSVAASGTIMVVYGIGGILAPLTSPFWIKRLGQMRKLIFWAFLIQIPLTIWFGTIQSYEYLMTMGFFLGYVTYLVNSPLNILITDVAGKAWAATAIGSTNFIFQFASMICPLIVGLSIDFTGTFSASWYIIALGSLVGMILISCVKMEETAV